MGDTQHRVNTFAGKFRQEMEGGGMSIYPMNQGCYLPSINNLDATMEKTRPQIAVSASFTTPVELLCASGTETKQEDKRARVTWEIFDYTQVLV